MQTQSGTWANGSVGKGVRVVALLILTLLHGCGGSSSEKDGVRETGSTKNAACTSTNFCWQGAEVSPGNCVSHPAYSSCAKVQGELPGEFADRVSFLFDTALAGERGEPRLQPVPVDPVTGELWWTLKRDRVGAVSGTVLHTQSGSRVGLANVKVSVPEQPNYAHVLTELYSSVGGSGNATGRFFMAVNGGQPIRLRFEKTGYLPAERVVRPVAGQFVTVPPVELVAEPTGTTITPGSPTVVAGATETDNDGTRTARAFFPSNTTWTHNGSPVTTNVTVGVKEYTVGDTGPERMPASLPPNSAYTYAVEVLAKDAATGQVLHPSFNKDVPIYVENFLDFDVGVLVPSGYYDADKGAWLQHLDASGNPLNGKVVKIVSISGTPAAANIDTTGNGSADNTGITLEERQQLASTYSTNTELWRVPVRHFSTQDFNWPFSIDSDASAPWPELDLPEDSPCTTSGSVIECETQVLGKSVPLYNTPFSLVYQSSRVPGYLAGRVIYLTARIVKGGGGGPKSVTFHVIVGGKAYVHTEHKPAGGWPDSIDVPIGDWDGKDAFGNPVDGPVNISIEAGANFDAQYAPASGFNLPPAADAWTSNGTRDEVTLWTTANGTLGSLNAAKLGFGGWTVDAQHVYAPQTGTIYYGSGGYRSAESLSDTIETAAGAVFGGTCSAGDGPATQRCLQRPARIAFGPDGALYIAEQDAGAIRKLLDGMLTTVVSGLSSPSDVAVDADGSLYIAETGTHRILKYPPGGPLAPFAGTGAMGTGGDGPATSVALNSPKAVDVSPDGTVYIADTGNRMIRRVIAGVSKAIVNTSGDGPGVKPRGDGGLATLAGLDTPVGVALAPDGNLYIADEADDRIRRVDPSGKISTHAGGGPDATGESVAATAAKLDAPQDVAVAPDGSVYIPEYANSRVRRVTAGLIKTIAGNADTTVPPCSGDGGAATSARVHTPTSAAFGPDGTAYISDYEAGGCQNIRRVLPAQVGSTSLGDHVVPSEDGSEVYIFNSFGRHLRTDDALTGKTIYTFNYTSYPDRGFLLTSIDGPKNGPGGITSFERDGAGDLFRITAPRVSSTNFATYVYLHAGGWLWATLPFNGGPFQYHAFYYKQTGNNEDTTGLLNGAISTDNDPYTYEYDGLGRVTEARDDTTPVGGEPFKKFEPMSGKPKRVDVRTFSGLVTSYKSQRFPSGTRSRWITRPDGSTVSASFDPSGARTVLLADGAMRVSTPVADPRFGLAAATTHETLDLDGKTLTAHVEREVSGGSGPLSFDSLTETRTIKSSATDPGLAYTQSVDRNANTIRWASPAGRQLIATYDAAGRVVQTRIDDVAPEVEPASYEYDASGRLQYVKQGNRWLKHNYNNFPGELVSTEVQDGSGTTLRTSEFSYEARGFVSQSRHVHATLPKHDPVDLAWNANGNPTRVTPTGASPGYSFIYGPTGAQKEFHNPFFGLSRLFDTDKDRRLSRDYGYTHSTTYGYSSTTGLPSSDSLISISGSTYTSLTRSYTHDTIGRPLTASRSGVTTAFGYGGFGKLADRISTTWPSAGQRDYQITYDSYLRPGSESVTGGASVTRMYDPDGFVTQLSSASSPTFTANLTNRSSQSGRLNQWTLGNLATTYAYNPTYGDPTSLTTSYSGSSKFGETLSYDAQGLIGSRTDTINGVASPTKTYEYDGSNRLWKSTVSGVTTTYGYDAHGNLKTINGAVVATYDVEDRLISFGNPAITFSHTSGTGERLTRTLNGQVTHHVYDSSHGLIQVRLPTAVTLDYTIDALGRRVTRKRLVNGILQNEKRYLYAEGNRLVAELNSSGTVVSQFVYARGAHVPDILIKGSTVYKMVTDHLGSVRLVINATTGSIAQRIDYDDWGTPTYVTGTPDLQPFAFAGGLWDPDTKLLHLGAREYDPEVRRFLTRDPSGFAGGWNLYGYAGNDPVNYVDPDGNTPWLAAAAVGAGVGAVSDIALQLATNGGNFDCLDWGDVAVSAGLGALGGAGALVKGAKLGSKLARGDDLVKVSRWGRPGLEPGDWVMKGGKNWWNYFWSGKWQVGLGNRYAPYSSGQTFIVPRSSLQRPTGWGLDGGIKTPFGQRKYVPSPPPSRPPEPL